MKTIGEIGYEFRRVMHMQTMEEMAQELQKLNLSTEGSQQDMHQRLLRFHLNKSYPDIVQYRPTNLCYKTPSQFTRLRLIYNNMPDAVEVSILGKTIYVNMQPEQPSSIGKAECETHKIHSQIPTDANTKEEKSESKNDKELIDYQLGCLNLLRGWILCNPYAKDETPKDFLGNLTDLRKFAKLDDETLLKLLPCVLWPSIKAWYRTKSFNSWQEFELSFLEEYGSRSIDIPKLTDSTSETIVPTLVAAETEASKSDCINNGNVRNQNMVMRETQTESLVAENIRTPAEELNIETRLHYLKSLKLWGLNFTGETGQPARTFLENLKNYRKFSHIDDLSLFEMLPCILDEKTRSWYRAKNFTSWDVFEPSFLNALVLLRDDDYPASPRLVSVAVGDSDLSAVGCSRYDSIDQPRPCQSSSYCLQAAKQKSSSIKCEIEDDDESVSSKSFVIDDVLGLNYHNARQDYSYAQPINYNYGHHKAAKDFFAFRESCRAISCDDEVIMNSVLYDEYATIVDTAITDW